MRFVRRDESSFSQTQTLRIKGYAWGNGDPFNNKNVYASNGCPDASANGMFSWCKKHGAKYGKISTIPERPGVGVYMNGHVGVYIGDGYVIEERGFNYGCVKTKLVDRAWQNWAEFPFITYEETAPKEEEKKEEPKIIEENNLLGYGLATTRVKLREKATTLSKSLKIINTDETIPVYDITDSGWLQTADGFTNFGNGKYYIFYPAARRLENKPSTWDKKYSKEYTVSASSLNLRAGAGTDYTIITAMPRGEKVQCYGWYTDVNGTPWMFIIYKNYCGFASSKYLG